MGGRIAGARHRHAVNNWLLIGLAAPTLGLNSKGILLAPTPWVNTRLQFSFANG